MMNEGEMITGAEMIVECLKTEEVKFVFGVIGSATLDFLDVIHKTPGIRYISTQHEQAAAFMADGYARITGETGVCTATCGPGVSHITSGIAGAFNESSPVLVIAGDIHTSHYGKGSSNSHEINQEQLFTPITKMSKRVNQADRIGEFMRMGFRKAQSGRKGPVFLSFPTDIQTMKVRKEVWPKKWYRSECSLKGDSKAIDEACNLILQAKSPVILVGGGVRWSRAAKEVMELAELLCIPIAVSHKGLIPEDHPWSVGLIGLVNYPVAMAQITKADLILALGCTFNQSTTASYTNQVIPRGAKIIQVDIDAEEFGKNFPMEIGIVGDVKAVLADMIDKFQQEGKTRGNDALLEDIALAKKQWDAKLSAEGGNADDVPIHRLRLIRDISKVMGKDAIMAAECGSTYQWFRYGFKSYSPIMEVGDYGCYGSAWVMAMGAKLAYPDRPAVSVTGDGGFMTTMNELATAVANDIPIVVIVTHNSIYGNVRNKQYQNFDGRFIGSDLCIPDLAKLAESFGAYGEKIEKPEQIIPALERALASAKPAVLDVVIDATRSQLEVPNKLRVKGVY